MVSTHPSTPSINVHVLDEQHAVLIENVERLEQAIASGQSADALPQIIREVAEYAAYHFPIEERLMASYNYPLRDLHAMEHRKFFERLGEMERMVKEGHATAAAQTLCRLRGWLDRHIKDWDARLGDFLNRCGVD
jgi:hemerythrin